MKTETKQPDRQAHTAGIPEQLAAQPRPWKSTNEGRVADAKGKEITVSGLGIGHGSSHQWPHGAANTEYILNAINSYDDLLAAAEAVVAALGGISNHEHEQGLPTEKVNAISRAFFKAQAALEKARLP